MIEWFKVFVSILFVILWLIAVIGGTAAVDHYFNSIVAVIFGVLVFAAGLATIIRFFD